MSEVIPFGKYAGKTWEEIPYFNRQWYIKRLLEAQPDSPLAKSAKEYLMRLREEVKLNDPKDKLMTVGEFDHFYGLKLDN
jgi:uncharacterized protein (DUF3820 family)